MRAFFGILFIAASLLGYEINHENWAKFYKFSGDANGVKFEVYLNYFKDEFENFKQTKSFKVPPKISGHIFFDGAKYDYEKGSLEQNGSEISYGILALKSGGIDPNLLNFTLSKSGFKIMGFDRLDGNLALYLDAKNMSLDASKVNFNEETPLVKSGGVYIVDVAGASSLNIISNEPNKWVPLVRIYDKNLNQIDLKRENEIKTNYTINLANDAKYALISDNNDITNIKNEIIIKLIK